MSIHLDLHGITDASSHLQRHLQDQCALVHITCTAASDILINKTNLTQLENFKEQVLAQLKKASMKVRTSERLPTQGQRAQTSKKPRSRAPTKSRPNRPHTTSQPQALTPPPARLLQQGNPPQHLAEHRKDRKSYQDHSHRVQFRGVDGALQKSLGTVSCNIRLGPGSRIVTHQKFIVIDNQDPNRYTVLCGMPFLNAVKGIINLRDKVFAATLDGVTSVNVPFLCSVEDDDYAGFTSMVSPCIPAAQTGYANQGLVELQEGPTAGRTQLEESDTECTPSHALITTTLTAVPGVHVLRAVNTSTPDPESTPPSPPTSDIYI